MDKFWELVDKTCTASHGDLQGQVALLIEEIALLPAEEILELKLIMDDLMDRAYDAALWDAAIIINCGCSDDGFDYFRGWLIAHGKAIYEQALADPETLVDLVEIDEWAADESFLYVAEYAYERKTREELPAYIYQRERPLLRGAFWPEETRNKRFPKLAEKFGDCDNRLSIMP